MATLNPSIILAGTNPDLMASFDQGQQAGERTNQIREQNALRGLYQEQGAGLLAGEQGAMNALAQINAPLAMDFRSSQQTLQINQENARLRAAELAASLDQATRTRAGEQFTMGANMIATAQTPEQFQAIVSRPGFVESAGILGITPDMLTFENRDTLAAAALGAADVMKMRAGPEPTTSQRDYQFYAQQERQAGRQPLSFNEWDMQGKKASGTTVTVNSGEGDKFYETLDKGQAEMFQGLINDGIKAGRSLQTLDQMALLLEGSPDGSTPGVQTGMGAVVQTMLGDLGIPSEGLSELQALEALINQIVPDQRQPGSGEMSNMDLALFKKSVPRLINQPGGNKIILDRMRGIAQYQAEQARIAAAVADRIMTPAQGRAALADLANPLEGFGKIVRDLPPPPAPTQGGGQQSMDFSKMSAEQLAQIDINGLTPAQMEAMLQRFNEVSQ